MKSSENLLKPLIERRILEAEADAAQSDVREQGVRLKVVGQGRAEYESGRCRGHAPHAQRRVRKPGERSRQLMRPDRIAVHKEIPAATFPVLGEMHQRASAVVDMDRRHPWAGRPKLQHTTP